MPESTHWTFLTNHAHVLICLVCNGEQSLRQVAISVGITERAVQKIVADLEEGGYLSRKKIGRRNAYVIHRRLPLRRKLGVSSKIDDLLNITVPR